MRRVNAQGLDRFGTVLPVEFGDVERRGAEYVHRGRQTLAAPVIVEAILQERIAERKKLESFANKAPGNWRD